MDEMSWKRTEYETWEEAFHGLAPVVRQQSVRVAAYTQALFVQACEMNFGKDSKENSERMKGKYADLAYKCGMYHQLGKALVPPEYQIWNESFTEEEKAVYKKYTSHGRVLAAVLQEKGTKGGKSKGDFSEQPTKNIPWLMIRESCEQHMERWDGAGYPEGKTGKAISPIAQIVGIAKELDRLASGTKSEDPFAEAMQILIDQSGTAWNPALVEVLTSSRSKCRAIYNKYIHYTEALPKTIPLVEKKKDRPMGLKYRPMISDTAGTVVAYEAIPWFGGVLGRPGETETADEVEDMLVRKKMVEDISKYFLYEAADAVLRIENCKLNLKWVLLRMMPSFYQLGTQLQNFSQLFKDQPISKEKLLLTVPAEMLANGPKNTLTLAERYLRNGIQLVLDGYDPKKHAEKLPSEKLKSMGFNYIRIDPELYMRTETADAIASLKEENFVIIGGEADSHDTVSWLEACGADCMSGTISGIMVSEDELIRDSLVRER
ncbi:MAG: EAL domain-containing protein [Oscillospiraceae bacterium]|nr:EAL domain-containing protein [Oscillospiraceae bacterium]